ncbi:hypothetical protein NE237_026693 [Protea cynaroides]|uniref:Uncharacterized protein n=1 Tax=Protea cynaroides TaxID=273540 RepID=A0A9Q0K1Q7_9MAGN|nr:hypothetical protein NE237_026693 [Protea cynaroides]
MATSSTFLIFRPAGTRASASSGHGKPENYRGKVSSANWWTPIFGWGSDPDYIDGNNNSSDVSGTANTKNRSESQSEKALLSGSRFAPGCFTAEKAKQLRLITTESKTFHDIMYHSAIASRLASDFPNRSAR